MLSAVAHFVGKDGPQLDVRLSAHVVTPELRVFPDAISFSSVPVGCCKVWDAPSFSSNCEAVIPMEETLTLVEAMGVKSLL